MTGDNRPMPPKMSADGRRRLLDEIQRLWVQAGSPSTRAIATAILEPPRISHSTVAQLLGGKHIPQWPLLSAIVQSLGGDADKVFELWKNAVSQHTSPPSVSPSKNEYLQSAVEVCDIAETCNALGAQGWKLVRIIASDTTADLHHLIMRRRRASEVLSGGRKTQVRKVR